MHADDVNNGQLEGAYSKFKSISLRGFELLEYLGKGSYGSVHSANKTAWFDAATAMGPQVRVSRDGRRTSMQSSAETRQIQSTLRFEVPVEEINSFSFVVLEASHPDHLWLGCCAPGLAVSRRAEQKLAAQCHVMSASTRFVTAGDSDPVERHSLPQPQQGGDRTLEGASPQTITMQVHPDGHWEFFCGEKQVFHSGSEVLEAGVYFPVVADVSPELSNCDVRMGPASSDIPVALKLISNTFANIVTAKRLLREVSLLSRLEHPNVIRYLGSLNVADNDNFSDYCYASERVDTDLNKIINSDQFFTNLHIQYFLYQIISGIKYLHDCNVIHRDVKPANLLVNSDCTLKICDFGLARTFDEEDDRDTMPLPDVEEEGKGENTTKIKLTLSGDKTAVPSAPPIRRQMTRHVVTRWYRAPELILLENKYSSAIDMWSVGCILAELFSMQAESFAHSSMREALFPGKSCYPLSMDNKHAYKDRRDQLNMIFDVIGTPSESDIAHAQGSKAKEYLRSLRAKDGIDLQAKYKGADKDGIDLLYKLLQFDPAKRITAAEALEHPFLANVKKNENVKSSVKKLDFSFEHTDLTKVQIRKLLVEEVRACNASDFKQHDCARMDTNSDSQPFSAPSSPSLMDLDSSSSSSTSSSSSHSASGKRGRPAAPNAMDITPSPATNVTKKKKSI